MTKKKVSLLWPGALIALVTVFLLIFLPEDSFSAVVGGAVALTIAFVLYPWQKERDRELKVDEERRVSLRNYIRAAEDYYTELSRLARANLYVQPQKVFDNLNSAKAEASLFSSGPVLLACRDLQQALIAYHSAVRAFLETRGTDAEPRNKKTMDEKYAAVKPALLAMLLTSRASLSADSLEKEEEDALKHLFRISD